MRYNDCMSDKPISKKRPVFSDSQEELKEDPSIDTVALMCIAVVSKAEYDAMMVENIDPIVVRGKDGQEVPINPFLLVGSLDKTKEEALNRVNMVWDTYKQRKNGE